MSSYTIRQGDCVASVAYEHGLSVKAIWDHPDNAELREKCGSPDTLIPGETLVLPEKQTETHLCQTGKRHVFRRTDVPKMMRVQIQSEEGPINDTPYKMKVDDEERDGSTDGEGWIEFPILPTAKKVVVEVEGFGEYTLNLGHLDPVETIRGAQQRLANLGYYEGAVDGSESDDLTVAIVQFQSQQGIEVTGQVDETTAGALVAACGD